MNGFLPISKQDMTDRGWYYCDFLIVTGDAYVDHPSFGTAIISRVLEDAGYKVAILSQPDFRDEHDFLEMGRPRYAVLINGGNIDSMVAHYTSAKKRRSDDAYTPGGVGGKRPDRAVTVYSMLARRAFPETPVYLGGIEASLRRFAHYDYWADRVMPSILESTGADGVMFGMSEHSDAVIVIVSEETGGISIAVDGMLKRRLSPDTFEAILRSELVPAEEQQRRRWDIIVDFVKKLNPLRREKQHDKKDDDQQNSQQ